MCNKFMFMFMGLCYFMFLPDLRLDQGLLQETKRPSKEMQVTIARQLGLEPTTVGNFFMNARRRSMDKWREEPEDAGDGDLDTMEEGGTQEHIKYEVYDGGLGGAEYGEQYGEMLDTGAGEQEQYAVHSMTVVPGPVHSQHQLHFPSTCT